MSYVWRLGYSAMTHDTMIALGTFALAIPGAFASATDQIQKARKRLAKKRGRVQKPTFSDSHPRWSAALVVLMVCALIAGFWMVFRHPLPASVAATPSAQSLPIPVASPATLPPSATSNSTDLVRMPLTNDQTKQIILTIDSEYHRSHPGSADKAEEVRWINAELRRRGYEFSIRNHPLVSPSSKAPSKVPPANSNPCPPESRTVFSNIYTDASRLPPGVQSTGVLIHGDPCLTFNGTVTNIGTTVGVDIEPSGSAAAPPPSNPKATPTPHEKR